MLPELFLSRFITVVPFGLEPQECFKAKKFRSFRINVLKATNAEIIQELASQQIACQSVGWYGDAFIVSTDDAKRLLESPLSATGKIYAQGLESMLAAIVLGPKAGDHVLDLCAAPGSKTTQIAAMMGNQGLIMANEPVRDRFFRLKAVVDLLGAQVKLTSKDGRFFRGEASFDAVLVDAPCSSEGRFCVDHPKSHAFWSLRKVHEMAHKQKGLLLNASRLVKKGGTLVYSTCTFGREENEDVVTWFLNKTAGQFRLDPIDVPGITTYPSSIPACLRVMPNDIMEGFFLAKFSS